MEYCKFILFNVFTCAHIFAMHGFVGGALGFASAPGLVFGQNGAAVSVINDLAMVGNDSAGFLVLENAYTYQATKDSSSNIISVTPMYKYCFFTHQLCLNAGAGSSYFIGSTTLGNNENQATNLNFALAGGIDYNINKHVVAFSRLLHFSNGQVLNIGVRPNPGLNIVNLGLAWRF